MTCIYIRKWNEFTPTMRILLLSTLILPALLLASCSAYTPVKNATPVEDCHVEDADHEGHDHAPCEEEHDDHDHEKEEAHDDHGHENEKK